MSETKVSITFDEYNQLLDRDQKLRVLKVVGVDNWEGYEEAMNILEEWNSED